MSGALRAGDEVEVRSADEILATLDPAGSAAGLPFMPEMLKHCGRRFFVSARAERICDTISHSGSMRLLFSEFYKYTMFRIFFLISPAEMRSVSSVMGRE